MNKKLVVFWRLCRMSDMVAQKGNWAKKEYKKQAMKTEFPSDIDPCKAIDEIIKEHGARPEPPIHVGHQFAEIIGWKVVGAS